MSHFDADYYRRFRPFYPLELFKPLVDALAQNHASQPFQIADLGCGTGHSAASLLATGLPAEMTGVDPDALMLSQARTVCPAAHFREGHAEETGLAEQSFHAITVGSAFHWFDSARAHDEFLRILKPPGLVFIFEYQFPKTTTQPELNEWIRREFNLRWKAPAQVPRGDFTSVTSGLRKSPKFRDLGSFRVPMVLSLNPEELTGMILSQSRVLHYVNTLQEDERPRFRLEVLTRCQELMQNQAHPFNFNLKSCLFEKCENNL